MDALAAIVRRYTEAAGRPPQSWRSLMAAGLVAGVPLDPTGTPYELRADAPGGVALSPKSSLHPIPPQFTKKAGPPS
jgi:hypothetical protein